MNYSYFIIKNEDYRVFKYIENLNENIRIIYIKNYIKEEFINKTKNNFNYFIVEFSDLTNFILKNNIKKIYIQNDNHIKKIINNLKRNYIMYISIFLDEELFDISNELYNYYICFNEKIYKNLNVPTRNKFLFNSIIENNKSNNDFLKIEILTSKEKVNNILNKDNNNLNNKIINNYKESYIKNNLNNKIIYENVIDSNKNNQKHDVIKNKGTNKNEDIIKDDNKIDNNIIIDASYINNDDFEFILKCNDDFFIKYNCDIYISSNLCDGYIDNIKLIECLNKINKIIIKNKVYYDLGGFDINIKEKYYQIYDFLYRAIHSKYIIYNNNSFYNKIIEYTKFKINNNIILGDEAQRKVSLILSIYNGIEYLETCLNNILNQTYDNIEIIIINDGTKVDIDDIIYKYQNIQNKYPIKYYKNEKNMGLPYSLNRGIYKSTGYYIAKIDVDDLMHRDKIKLQVEHLEKNKNIDMSVTSFYDFTDDNKINEDEVYKTYNNKKKYKTKEIKENYTINMINHCICIGTMLIKRDCLFEIGGYDNSIKYGEDLDLAARFVNYGYNIEGIMNNLYFRRIIGDRMSNISNIAEVHKKLVEYVKNKLKDNKFIGDLGKGIYD